jgi:ankyrin repeat protein
MMELLVSHGADVNALWHGHFPIIFAPCEALDAAALKWLLDHGANPNLRDHGFAVGGHEYPGTALDYLVASYARSLEPLSDCIDVLLQAGGETRYNMPAVLAVFRGRLDDLAKLIDGEPGIVNQSFPELDCGQTGGRSLLLQGGTLLHVAAEYGNVAAATLLLDRGADVNGRATVDEAGIGGQTAIFHAVTQFDDGGLPVTQLLLERGADLNFRVKLPGDYERPGEIVECTPLGYALLFGGDSQRRTVTLLREWGAME